MTDDVVETPNEAEAPPPRLLIDDSARDTTSRVWYALPSSFMSIPLDALAPEPGSESERQVEQAMGSVLDAVPEGMQETYRGALHDVRSMAQYMEYEGVIGCAIGMHIADDGSSALSVFTVALQEIEWAPPKITALRAVSLRECPQNVGVLSLTGGKPASVSDTLVPTFSVEGMPPQDLYQCNVYVPDPAGTQLAVLTLSSTAVSTREQYREMMEGIAYTVSFEDPMPEIERAARENSESGRSSSTTDDIASDFG